MTYESARGWVEEGEGEEVEGGVYAVDVSGGREEEEDGRT